MSQDNESPSFEIEIGKADQIAPTKGSVSELGKAIDIALQSIKNGSASWIKFTRDEQGVFFNDGAYTAERIAVLARNRSKVHGLDLQTYRTADNGVCVSIKDALGAPGEDTDQETLFDDVTTSAVKLLEKIVDHLTDNMRTFDQEILAETRDMIQELTGEEPKEKS